MTALWLHSPAGNAARENDRLCRPAGRSFGARGRQGVCFSRISGKISIGIVLFSSFLRAAGGV